MFLHYNYSNYTFQFVHNCLPIDKSRINPTTGEYTSAYDGCNSNSGNSNVKYKPLQQRVASQRIPPVPSKSNNNSSFNMPNQQVTRKQF